MRKRKKTNKNIKLLIILILGIIAIFSVYMFLKGKGFAKGATSEAGEYFVINIKEEQLVNEKNIYNVEYGQKLLTEDVASAFETTALAQIRGEKVTFTNYDQQKVTTTKGKTCIENNIMAAIISGAGVKETGYKYKENEEYYYSGAQLAIWEFWNTWVEHSGANENRFEKGMGNAAITENGINGEIERKKAQDFATQNTYNVNIHFLKYFAHNNLTAVEEDKNIKDNLPNLIWIEVLDEEEKVKEELEIDGDISIQLSSSIKDVVKVGEEIIYYVDLYNTTGKDQQNIVVNNILPQNITLTKVAELINYEEVELSEGTDYKYNKETRKMTINVDKIEGIKKEPIIDGETGEIKEEIVVGSKLYIITAKVNELEEGLYSKEIKNIVQVKRENTLISQKKVSNTISDVYLEVKKSELPNEIKEGEEWEIELTITNKGLITAQNVNVDINIPKEILPKVYKEYLLSETGEKENFKEGIFTNKIENYIEIPGSKTYCIKLTGTINEIVETKQISIEGFVNTEKISWTTKLKNSSQKLIGKIFNNEKGGC